MQGSSISLTLAFVLALTGNLTALYASHTGHDPNGALLLASLALDGTAVAGLIAYARMKAPKEPK